MPSLKMKMKSTTGCLREKNGLHVCQKSSKISKNSLSHVTSFQQETQLETCISNKHDDSFGDEATVQEIRSEEAKCCELLDEENIQDHMEDNCSSTIETIFSPIQESTNNDNEPNVSNDKGSEKNLDLESLGDNNSDGSSQNLCEFQSCNVSDFFISDMIVSSTPIERGSACLPDYERDELSRFFDDEYMMLPFLEESIETGKDCVDDSRICSEPVTGLEESNLFHSTHQLKPCNPETDVNIYPDWDPAEFLDPQIFIRNLPDLSETETTFRPAILPQEKKSITLVLDLDETLVHSSLERCVDADFTFPVFFDFEEHIFYMKERPCLKEFLERVSKMFQIVVFTASQSIYAKQLLDILDPDGTIISGRAYRESCVFADGSYTKDLTVLGVDLAKIAIIDGAYICMVFGI